MGRIKAGLEEEESQWNIKAHEESIRCDACSQHIILTDRECYDETGMCSSCNHSREQMMEE